MDLMRRAGLQVKMAGVGGMEITGSHGITVGMDLLAEDVDPEELEAVVLPGGLPGTLNLERSEAVQSLLDHCAEREKWIAAICAAPSILAHKGLLRGREATAFPKFQEDVEEGGGRLSEAFVCRDGRYITARGMGVSTQFGLKLVEVLVSPEKAEELRRSIQWEA